MKKIISAVCLALVLLMLASCSFIDDVVLPSIGTALESMLDELLETGDAVTDTPTVAVLTTSDDPETPTGEGSSAAPEPTQTEPETPPVTAAPPEPFTDAFVPGYGSETVIIDKSNPIDYRYWRTTVTDADELTAYDALDEMVKNDKSTAVLPRPVPFDKIKSVYKRFTLDHPEYFWNVSRYTGNGSTNAITSITVEASHDQERIAPMRAEIEKVASLVISQIPDGASDFEAEKIIFSWMINNIVYDSTPSDKYNLYGALVKKRCVCEGFAEAFKYLCGKVGIPVITISGLADNSQTTENHAWSAVRIGGKWYLSDVTWAHSGQPNRFLYFNLSEHITPDHRPLDELSPLLPDFSSDDASYLKYYGLYFDDTREGDLGFDSAFMRSVLHFTDVAMTGASATVYMMAKNAATAEKYAQFMKDEDYDEIADMLERVSHDGYSFVVYTEPEIIDGRILSFRVARMKD